MPSRRDTALGGFERRALNTRRASKDDVASGAGAAASGHSATWDREIMLLACHSRQVSIEQFN